MSKTSDGTKAQPQFASSGNTPTFAADLTLLSDFFASRSFRHLSTVAGIYAATGMTTDDYAIATNAPGGMFRYNGSAWKMHGVATFTSSSARSTALGANVHENMLSIREDTDVLEQYIGSTWVPVGFGNWTNYTPALTNFTIGTGGTANGVLEYRTEGDQVHVRGALTLGTSGSSVGSIVQVALPVTGTAPVVPYRFMSNNVTLYDISSGTSTPNQGVVMANNVSTTTVLVRIMATGGSITSTAPFTWAAGDSIDLDFYFNPA